MISRYVPSMDRYAGAAEDSSASEAAEARAKRIMKALRPEVQKCPMLNSLPRPERRSARNADG